MTREEAIICLKGIKNYGRDTFNEQSDWQGCLDMAIKALEREPKLQNRCFALTQGQMCLFCPYECEHKAESEGEK